MKRKQLLVLGLSVMLAIGGMGNLSVTAHADDGVTTTLANSDTMPVAANDIVNIPDPVFQSVLRDALNLEPGAEITKADMETLYGLDLGIFNDIQDATGIEYAVNLQNLQVGAPVSKGLEQIGKLSNLVTLTVNLDHFDFDQLGVLPHLKELSINNMSTLKNLNGITPEKLPALENLQIAACQNINDISALDHQAFPKLTTVYFYQLENLKDISPLKGYTTLKNLHMSYISINAQTDPQVFKDTIKSLTGLKELVLDSCDLTDANTDIFDPLTNLTKLAAPFNKFTNTAFCDKLPAQMTHLELNGNKISNMDNLVRFKDLTCLVMKGNHVTDFRFLSKMTKLTSDLWLSTEGTDLFPCSEYYKVSDINDPLKVNGTMTLDNPYIGIDGKPISFKDAEITTKNCDLTYDAAANQFALSNVTSDAGFDASASYTVTLSDGSKKLIKTVFSGKAIPAQLNLNEFPVLHVNDITLVEGDKFDPLAGVKATDKEDGDLTSSIKVVENTVNSNKTGIYKVTYTVKDSQGAATTVTVKVEILAKTTPTPSVKPETKPSVKPEVKPSVKPEEKPSAKPEAKPSVKPETKPSVSPQTGDTNHMMLWISFAISALGITTGTVFYKKKETK